MKRAIREFGAKLRSKGGPGLFYYAGHGAPGLKDNKGYFVPVDCDPQYIEHLFLFVAFLLKNFPMIQSLFPSIRISLNFL